jgi:serine/threonine protein kinase
MSDKGKKKAAGAKETPEEPTIGTVLGGRYRLDVLLGGGAMGRVFRAEHVLMHKPLAVKILNKEHTKNRELVARFEREATAAANIEHPNVVAATDFGKLEDGTVYLALELVQGKNLRAEIAKGALEVRRALHIARQVASGLAAAHARNIVHRDLKPENVILVEKDGDPDFVKILDFGIAKLAPESGKSPLTKVGVVLGTLDYMAPEQALGQEVDHRADLYALGVLAYEMLCGAVPYEGESSSAILGLQLTKTPPSLRERAPTLAIPGAVEALVMKLLSKERKERPQTAAAVVAELDRLVTPSAAGTPAPKQPAAGPRFPPPRPATAGGPPRPGGTASPVQNKPTFLSSDPLPAFTFPPLEEESKKLAEQVKQAVASRVPPPPTKSAPSHPAPPPPKAPPMSPVSSSPAVDSLLAAVPPPVRTEAAPAASPFSSSPSVDALLAAVPQPSPPAEGATPSGTEAQAGAAGGGKQKLEQVRARALEIARTLRARAGRAIGAAIAWIDDNRRFLPKFIKRPLRRVPSGALFVGLLVLLAMLLFTVVLLATGSDESAEAVPASSASAAAAASSAPHVAPASSVDEGSRAAIARAEAELKAGNWSGVTSSLELALQASPTTKQNERVAEMLGEAARHRASANAGFKLLSGPMEGKGAEVLYDLAVHQKTPNDLRAKAEEWIGTEEFRRVASPPLAIAGKLRSTRSCQDKKALLDEAATTGDRRALDYLRILAVKGGCGRRGREDCFPCLRQDETIGEAIAKIEQRLAASKAP